MAEPSNKDDSPIESVAKESGASDVAHDVAEIAADVLLKEIIGEGLMKDVPFIKTIEAVIRAPAAIRDQILFRKVAAFLGRLHAIPETRRQEMVERLDAEAEFGQRVGEHLIELLDRVNSNKKPAMLGVIFKAYAEKRIDIMTLHRLSTAVERLPSHRITSLRRFKAMTPAEHSQHSPTLGPELMNVGLVSQEVLVSGMAYPVNDLGKAFLALELDRV